MRFEYVFSVTFYTMPCGNCGGIGHNRRTCSTYSTEVKNAVAQDAPVKKDGKDSPCRKSKPVVTILELERKTRPEKTVLVDKANKVEKINQAGTKVSTVSCSACGETGHNKRTCARKSACLVSSETSKASIVHEVTKTNFDLSKEVKKCEKKKSENWLSPDALKRLAKGMTKADGEGHIYMYMKSEPKFEEDEHWFKIGESMHQPERRVRKQELSNKEEYKLLWSAHTPCRKLTEKVIHIQLKDFHCPKEEGDGKTEWFMGHRNLLTEKARSVVRECKIWFENEQMDMHVKDDALATCGSDDKI